MKKILFLISLIVSLPLMAKDIETDSVLLQAMDKITGRVKKIEMSVGEHKSFEEVVIQVDKCMTKPPEEAPENSAFIRITSKEDSEKELFKGWMFSSNPAISAMEDPVYDIWVVSCYNKQMFEPNAEEPILMVEPDKIPETIPVEKETKMVHEEEESTEEIED